MENLRNEAIKQVESRMKLERCTPSNKFAISEKIEMYRRQMFDEDVEFTGMRGNTTKTVRPKRNVEEK